MENLIGKQKRYLKNFWIIFISPVIFLILLFFFIAMGWLGFMPTIDDLINPKRNLASEVYSDDGKVLGTFFIEENRNMIEYKDLSPYLVQALIAREDKRFKKHSGIDAWGLFRVMVKTIMLSEESQGGGSTISQQLAKNLYTRQYRYKQDTIESKSKFGRKIELAITKFKEWVIAVRLERNYSKDEIITMYFNTVPFGNEASGIKAASRAFFNKSPDSLKIEEAAMLVAMLKGNTKYHPKRNPEKALMGRNVVLSKMYEQNYINKIQYDSLNKVPINLDYQSQAHDAGHATYLREYIRKTVSRSKPERKNYYNYNDYKRDSLRWAEDPIYGWCNKNFKPDGSTYNLYKDGLKIYTTINSKMQEYAETALREHLSKTVQPNFFAEKKQKEYRKKAPYSNDPIFTDDFINMRLTVAMHQTDRYRKLRNSGYSEKEILKFFKIPVEMKVFSWKGDIDTTMTPWDSIRYYKFYIRASFMAVDPHTGYIKAYVGGPDFRYFQYDGVMDQKRQVGSTIKPFLYALAMEEGLTPCSKILNAPITIQVQDTVWRPRNASDTKYDGKEVPLWWALANSVNYVSARLIDQFNPQSMVNIIKKMGVKSDLIPVPSLCVGVAELSLYELVGAYTSFPNKGFYTQPIYITRIEDKNGNMLTTCVPQKVEAIDERSAYTMTKMLERVALWGTAARLRYKYNLTNMGGKTGTTDNNSDGWFVGITPNLVAGAWVGGDEPGIHFNNMKFGEGAAVALPIFAEFMKKVYADPKLNFSNDPFEPPDGFNVNFDCPVGESAEQIKNDNTKKDVWDW
jgi:penicillin-binding protein 1A